MPAAYEREQLSIARTLLDKGADPDARDNMGRTPLQPILAHTAALEDGVAVGERDQALDVLVDDEKRQKLK